MGYIKEPDGIEFVVENKPLTEEERKQVSDIIANYKSTGRKTKLPSTTSVRRRKAHKKILASTKSVL